MALWESANVAAGGTGLATTAATRSRLCSFAVPTETMVTALATHGAAGELVVAGLANGEVLCISSG